ncbi:MAG: hypothetical protein ACRC11_21025 [Xenococcaceae cyanobacterium]
MRRVSKIWLATFLIGFFGFILISPINAQQFLTTNAVNSIEAKNIQQIYHINSKRNGTL